METRILNADTEFSEAFRVKGRQNVTISGQAVEGRRPVVSGFSHSLFLVDKNATLRLSGLTLHHTRIPSSVHEAGAVALVREKGTLIVEDCEISSDCGFGLWAIHSSTIELSRCRLHDCGRSSAVCFGSSSLSLKDCVVENSAVHAICGRGKCSITLTDVMVRGSEKRAVYGYGQATMRMTRCTVTGTRSTRFAAVEVGAGASLELSGTRIHANAGNGLSVSSDRSHLHIQNTDVSGNGDTDIVYTTPDTATELGVCGVWVWEYDQEEAGWKAYPPECGAFLERAYSEYESGGSEEVQLPPPLEIYMVSLRNMTQTNTHSHFPRRVRRRPSSTII